ncbi:hypothetical protein HYE53_11070 [Aggregatibacter actinomycetemcomitans]|uniref:hypothetical protein n=1 Tax=Aggregatibacter actinomycetemcomitans TaxID=714 RepID=UPI00197C8671|nr:hypothetical protein [Aggregatibacter actinomycetemcomitans]MBN6071594.1 hypothetical protein [Aggregatibacter actinomycetemcomitans]
MSAASLQNFRKANSMEQRKQGKAGLPFFWLLFFGNAKKSNGKQKGVHYTPLSIIKN